MELGGQDDDATSLLLPSTATTFFVGLSAAGAAALVAPLTLLLLVTRAVELILAGATAEAVGIAAVATATSPPRPPTSFDVGGFWVEFLATTGFPPVDVVEVDAQTSGDDFKPVVEEEVSTPVAVGRD